MSDAGLTALDQALADARRDVAALTRALYDRPSAAAQENLHAAHERVNALEAALAAAEPGPRPETRSFRDLPDPYGRRPR